MIGRKLEIDPGDLALARFVLDAQVRQQDLAVDDRKIIVPGDLVLELPVLLGWQLPRLGLGKRRVDSLLELVIEDDPPDPPFELDDPGRLGLVHPVDRSVVGDLGELLQACVERLRIALPGVILMSLLRDEPLSLLREKENFEPSLSADLECPPAHEPLADKLPEPTVRVRSVALEVKAREVLGGYRPELADRPSALTKNDPVALGRSDPR